MSNEWLLPGISQNRVTSDRLEMAYLETGTGDIPVVLVHGNCSSSLFFQDFMLALAANNRYKVLAPDMRGYGDTEPLPVDATRGVRDWSDDLDSFARALGLNSFHLFGWSLGGNIVMQYAIDHPGSLRSLTLQDPGSPYGFGGTRDAEGTLDWPDAAGSGGGTVNPDFVQRIADKDRGYDQNSPRTVMNTFYFKPPFKAPPDREEIYVTSILTTRVGPDNYPGDTTTSQNWPFVAPGTHGVNNALAPTYLNQNALATTSQKPPLLWVHGANDQIVSDTSFFDMGYLGQLGFVPGWPGAEVYPPQPMVEQIRTLLNQYQANGGAYREVVIEDCGHSPHIEKQEELYNILYPFLVECDAQ
ncbi:MAG TPA: alpha/beta hydrolase [Ktedonobacteraceae bacterium]|nr:alpha/beta hydrolase [Ktedonobacteraceae bacterium]